MRFFNVANECITRYKFGVYHIGTKLFAHQSERYISDILHWSQKHRIFWKGNIKVIECLSILGILLFLLSIFIILITRKITKVSPVRAIAFGHAPVYFSSRINFSLDKANFIPLSIKISVKQIITHLKQYVMLFIVVGILTSFIISIGSISNMIIGDNAENIFVSF